MTFSREHWEDSGRSYAPPAPDVPGCRAALEAYFREKGLWYDTRWYTPEEWAERDEPYGESALLNLTFEGSLNHELNYGWESHPPFGVQERVVAIAAEYGLWFALGYAWSAHFYPLGK